jgi:hypothetical protein
MAIDQSGTGHAQFGAGTVRGTLIRVGGSRWEAHDGAAVSSAGDPVAAVLGLPRCANADLVILDVNLDDQTSTRAVERGVPFVSRDGTIYGSELIADCGEHVTEHPDFEEVALVVPKEAALAEDVAMSGQCDSSPIGLVGRLGDRYFWRNNELWCWEPLGWFDRPEDAAEAAAGADFSWEIA